MSILYIEESEHDEIIGMDIPMESNLIYKAVLLVREKYNIKKNVKIEIEKNIPSFAGLGGGSSDAAFTIKALNELWDLNMQVKEMCQIAEQLGSDVPFFIYNKPAIISGRGEKIKIVSIPELKGILIFDDYKFSTKEVFMNMKEYSLPYEEVTLNSENDLYKYVTNDMEKGISIYKESEYVFNQKKELIQFGARCASMSGSGSSVFGLFDDEKKLNKAYIELKDKYNKIWKFNVLN